MHRRALLVPALLLSLLPAGAASACHGSGHYVDTLTVALPSAPATARAGAPTALEVAVTRAGSPVAEAEVYLRLQHGPDQSAVTYGRGVTGVDGRTELRADVPRTARGSLRVTVEAFRHVASAPCYGTVEEHGIARSAWGRAVR